MNGKILAVFLVSTAIIAGGCISNNGEEIPQGDVNVAVGEMYYQQQNSTLSENILEAEEGDEIVFYNEGSISHTVTIEKYGIDENLDSGESIKVQADETGEDILVDCTLHENHEATLTVS